MKDRIHDIMDQEGMTQQAFASALSISPASLSSIFTGRTNPTQNHVQAIHRTFPKININWLMFGEGEMYSKGEREKMERMADEPVAGVVEEEKKDEQKPFATAQQVQAPTVIREIRFTDRPPRQITEIRIFFDDGTYETFSKTANE